MYITINEHKYNCSRRIVEKDTIKYLTVKPIEDAPALDPDSISGTIVMCSNDDFVLSEDNADAFTRKKYSGTLLTLTNAPEPAPIDPTTTPEYRMSQLEQAMNALLKGEETE